MGWVQWARAVPRSQWVHAKAGCAVPVALTAGNPYQQFFVACGLGLTETALRKCTGTAIDSTTRPLPHILPDPDRLL